MSTSVFRVTCGEHGDSNYETFVVLAKDADAAYQVAKTHPRWHAPHSFSVEYEGQPINA